MVNYVSGTYTAVQSKELAEFCLKMGYPKEIADSYANSHWTMKIEECGNKVVVTSNCKEMPMLDMVVCYEMGVEKSITIPSIGIIRAYVNKIAENKYEMWMDADFLKKTTILQEYDEDGAKFTCKINETGDTATKVWEREVCMEGSYVFVKGENVDNYIKKTNSPMQMGDGYKTKIECCGPRVFKITQFAMGLKFTNTLILDEEITMDNMGEKFSCLLTRSGKNELTCVGKWHSRKITEEMQMKFHPNGLTMNLRCMNTGDACKFYMERFVDVTGKFKVVSIHGMESFLKALGTPATMLDTVLADAYQTTVEISQVGPMWRSHTDSKLMPQDLTFKLDEEFTYVAPPAIDPTGEKLKCIVTRSEDTFCLCAKGKLDMISTAKVTPNFMIRTMKIAGTNIVTKEIYERICC